MNTPTHTNGSPSSSIPLPVPAVGQGSRLADSSSPSESRLQAEEAATLQRAAQRVAACHVRLPPSVLRHSAFDIRHSTFALSDVRRSLSSLPRRAAALALCLAALLLPLRAAADVFDAPYLYIPQPYLDYFYNNLQAAIRERARLVSAPTCSAYGWTDGTAWVSGAEYRLYGGTDGWTTDRDVQGKTDARLRYRDGNGNGRWDDGHYDYTVWPYRWLDPEYVWYDADGNGVYNHGEPLLAGTASAANSGEWGKQNGLFFHDANSNGAWDANEDVWFDIGTLAGDAQTFQSAMTYLIPHFVNQTDHGGNWDGVAFTSSYENPIAPLWTEPLLLAEIGSPSRIGAGDLRSAEWMKQQKEILGRLAWSRYGYWTVRNGEYKYGAGADPDFAVAMANAIADFSNCPWTPSDTVYGDAHGSRVTTGDYYTTVDFWRYRCEIGMSGIQTACKSVMDLYLPFYWSDYWQDASPDWVWNDEGQGFPKNTYQLIYSETTPSHAAVRYAPLVYNSSSVPPWNANKITGWGNYRYGGAAWARYPVAVLKWNVPGGLPPLAAPPTTPWPITTAETLFNTTPDTNRDDLVDVGTDLASFGPDTGTIAFAPDRELPQVIIPLGVTCQCLFPVHVYLAQGGFDAPRNTYLTTQADVDENGLYLAYSLHTRARIQAVVINATEHIKRIEVIRPRGNAVTFEFAWDSGAGTFAELGYPAGINADRTYVLRDTTPTNHTDLAFDLCFDSGVIHRFSGALTKIVLADGASVTVLPGATDNRLIQSDMYWFSGAYSEVAVNLAGNTFSNARYSGSIAWHNGRPWQIVYTARGYPGAVTTTLTYDAEGHVVGLAKSVQNAAGGQWVPAPGLSASCEGNSIAYGSGVTTTRAGAFPGVVTLASAHPDRGTVVEEFVFGANGLLTQRTSTLNGFSETTSFTYQPGTGRYVSGTPKWGKLMKVEYPDGSWERFEYAPDTGWPVKWLRPFADAAPDAAESACRLTEFAYDRALSDPSADAADPTRVVERPRCLAETTLGVETKRTYAAYAMAYTNYGYTTPGGAATVRQSQRPGALWGDSSNLGSKSTRDRYWWAPNALTTPAGSVSETASVTYDPPTPTGQAPVFSTEEQRNVWPMRTQQSRNAFGFPKTSNVLHYVRLRADTSELGLLGQPVQTAHLDGTTDKFFDLTWAGPSSIVAGDNLTSLFAFDPDGLVHTTTVPDLDLAETLGYDLLGNVTRLLRTGGGGITQTIQTQYDPLGRVRALASPLGTTSYAYGTGMGGGTTVTVTYPDGRTLVVERYRDGAIKAVSGTGADAPVQYEYSVDGSSDAKRWYAEERRLGPDGTHSIRTRYYFDMLGRNSVTETLDAAGNWVAAQTATFNPTTGLAEILDRYGRKNVMVYDNYLQPGKTGLDTDGDKTLNLSSTDRLVQYDRTTVMLAPPGGGASKSAYKLTVNAFPSAGSPTPECLISLSEAEDGSLSALQTPDTTLAAKRTYTGAPGGWTVTTTDETTGRSVIETWNLRRLDWRDELDASGNLTSVTHYGYDGLGRLTRETRVAGEPALVTTITTYEYDAKGRVCTVQPPDQAGPTEIVYVPGSLRPATVTFGAEGMLEFQYDDHGRLKQRKYTPAAAAKTAPLGLDPYQVSYEYYPNGQVWKQATLRNGHTVETVWQYHARTGDLMTKTVAGTLVESHTWNPDGTPATDTDAEGRIATYNYDTVTGDLPSVGYSGGSAPGFTLSDFDRDGRPHLVTTTAGTTSLQTHLDYDAADRVTSEQRNAFELLGAVDVTRQYAPGSSRLVAAGLAGGPVATYTPDPEDLARVKTVSAPGFSMTYEYDTAGRPWRLHRSGDGGPELTRVLTYDAANRLDTIDETADCHFKLDYGPDSRKIERVELTAGQYWQFEYDGNGHLKTATQRRADGSVVAGRRFAYAHDEIGNPLIAGPVRILSDQPSTSFITNDANQAATRTWDCIVSVYGTVAADCSVTVEFNGQTYAGTVTAAGEFVAEFPVSPAEWPANGNCQATLAAVQETATASTMAELPLEFQLGSGSTVVASYDDCGAPQSAGCVTYNWKADGTLESIELDEFNRVEYLYDHQGRLIDRKLRTRAETVTPWDTASIVSQSTFIYDGWRPLREQRQSYEPSAHDITIDYIWGLDLSGSYTGAAGIGGLLAVKVGGAVPAATYLPIFDWNGNAVRYLDASDLSVAAEFEYAPFGDVIASSGPAVDVCNLRFSTKYQDPETGLYYFGLRWLDPRTAKWLTRDPIGEQGGENLYSHCTNDPVNLIDPVGADSVKAAAARLKTAVEQIEVEQDYARFRSLRNEIDAIVREHPELYGASVVLLPPSQGPRFGAITPLGDMQAPCEGPTHTVLDLGGAVTPFFGTPGVVASAIINAAHGTAHRGGQRAMYFAGAAFPFLRWGKTTAIAEEAVETTARYTSGIDTAEAFIGPQKLPLLGDSNLPVIIGEDMRRVNLYAKREGGLTIDQWLAGTTWSQSRNDQFIAVMKAQGREFIDIGPSFDRRLLNRVDPTMGRPPSTAYGGERRQLLDYENYRRKYERLGKYQGGVPGFDF